MCLINKKEQRCGRSNIFKIWSQCIWILLPQNCLSATFSPSVSGRGRKHYGCDKERMGYKGRGSGNLIPSIPGGLEEERIKWGKEVVTTCGAWPCFLRPESRGMCEWIFVGGSTIRSRQKLVAEEILMRGPVWGSWRRQPSRMKHTLGFQAAGKRESLSEAL